MDVEDVQGKGKVGNVVPQKESSKLSLCFVPGKSRRKDVCAISARDIIGEGIQNGDEGPSIYVLCTSDSFHQFLIDRGWLKKSGQAQNLANSKKSTILLQSL